MASTLYPGGYLWWRYPLLSFVPKESCGFVGLGELSSTCATCTHYQVNDKGGACFYFYPVVVEGVRMVDSCVHHDRRPTELQFVDDAVEY